MIKVHYPKGDPRREDAILAHGTPVKVVNSTNHLDYVEKANSLDISIYPIHPDFLRKSNEALANLE